MIRRFCTSLGYSAELHLDFQKHYTLESLPLLGVCVLKGAFRNFYVIF